MVEDTTESKKENIYIKELNQRLSKEGIWFEITNSPEREGWGFDDVADLLGKEIDKVNAGEMILLTVDVEKGSEESGSVDLSNIDIVSKTMLENPTIAQEVKDQILEKLKATQKRGFAKETGYILEIKKTDDAYEILPEDFEGGESEDVVEVQQAGIEFVINLPRFVIEENEMQLRAIIEDIQNENNDSTDFRTM